MFRFGAALLLTLITAVFANPLPYPGGDAEFGETSDPAGATVPETPGRYSWAAGLFGNLVPGLGYFLIEEPVWGAVELGLVGGGVVFIVAGSQQTSFLSGIGEMVIGGCLAGAAYLGGLIHGPLLAEWKNEHQSASLELSLGLGVAGNGECYPTLNLALRF